MLLDVMRRMLMEVGRCEDLAENLVEDFMQPVRAGAVTAVHLAGAQME